MNLDLLIRNFSKILSNTSSIVYIILKKLLNILNTTEYLKLKLYLTKTNYLNKLLYLAKDHVDVFVLVYSGTCNMLVDYLQTHFPKNSNFFIKEITP